MCVSFVKKELKSRQNKSCQVQRKAWSIMERDTEYIQQQIGQYKTSVLPLLRYLPWLEKNAGGAVSMNYNNQELGEHSITFPVYDGTLMSFVREAQQTSLMDRNYQYVYTRNRIRTHREERKMIEKATWRDWNILCGIFSKYVLGGRVKATLWNEAVQERIFYLVLRQMKDIIEFWDKPIDQRI